MTPGGAARAQEAAVEYVAATLHRLMKEAEAEGIRRLFLISVRSRGPARRRAGSLSRMLKTALLPPAPV